MPKKIIVKEAGFIDFVKSFFNAKSKGNAPKFITSLKKVNPELGAVWQKWSDSMDNSLVVARNYWERKGNTKKVKELDDLIKKYESI